MNSVDLSEQQSLSQSVPLRPPMVRMASCHDLIPIVRKEPVATRLWLMKQITYLENTKQLAKSDAELQEIERAIAMYQRNLIKLAEDHDL